MEVIAYPFLGQTNCSKGDLVLISNISYLLLVNPLEMKFNLFKTSILQIMLCQLHGNQSPENASFFLGTKIKYLETSYCLRPFLTFVGSLFTRLPNKQ